MVITEYIPSCVVTILFLAIMPHGSDVWIKADTIISSCFGLIITFFPRHFLSRQIEGTLDDVHLHIYRLCGIMILCSSLFATVTRNSKEPAVVKAILWGRTVGISIYVSSRIYSYIYIHGTVTWNNQALVFGIYGDCLWLLGNFIYAFSIPHSEDRRRAHSKVDVYIKSDCVQCILFGLTFYIMPKLMLGFQTLKQLDNLHVTLLRMMSAFVFNTGVIAWKSLHFLNERNKMWHVISRILVGFGLLAAQLFVQLTTSSWTMWHIYFGMTGMIIWSMNSVIGFLSLSGFRDKMNN